MTCRILYISNIDEWHKQTSWMGARTAPSPEIENATQKIIATVKNDGDKALYKYAREFDCPDLSGPLRVPENEILQAPERISPQNCKFIAKAIENIRRYHEAQIEKSWFMSGDDGIILGQMVNSVDSAGLYVPGGKGGATPLISSLLMNAIPALVAGCPRIAVVSPSRPDGGLDNHLLAAAALLGITEIYRIGGAWSIAALAYGTESIAPVSVIAGPGNIYVTTAKKILHGQVGIDMIAGPSEVLIISDNSADPSLVAADMLAQAEHDTLASAICLTSSEKLANEIERELALQLPALPRGNIAQQALDNWSCIAILPSLELAVEIANSIAPEHLELHIRSPWETLPKIKHAGAVFLGDNSAEAVGDYFAGPNHVLPTLGTARFASALSVQTFSKKTSIIAGTKAYLDKNSDAIAALARLEGLEAHARSVEARKNR